MKCEITDKETYKIWNAPLYVEGHICIPRVLAEHENYMMAPTYLALQSLEGRGREIITSPQMIACRLGINLTNRRAIIKIQDCLNYFLKVGMIQRSNVTRVGPATMICGSMERTDEVTKLLDPKKKFALIYHHEIKEYAKLQKKYTKLKFFQYITQLARLRGCFGCGLNTKKTTAYWKCSYSVISTKTFEDRLVSKIFTSEEWLQIFYEAKIFAWATFDRMIIKGEEPHHFIAIVNYTGTDNLKRIQDAIRLSNVKLYSKSFITNIHY